MEWLTLAGVATIALFTAGMAWLNRYYSRRAAASANRMLQMMVRVGVDPRLVLAEDPRGCRLSHAMERCITCQVRPLCDCWLADNVGRENVFCPNAETFRELARQQRSQRI